MRRFLGVVSVLAGASLMASCGEVTDSLVPEGAGEPDPFTLGVSADIFDGTSNAPGANPHFFFLSPLVPNPDYSGIADDNLKPTLTICPELLWDTAAETCSTPLAVFSLDALGADDQLKLTEGSGYSAVWKTNTYPAPAGEVFRVSVSVYGKVLGWVDVKSYDQQTYNSFKHTDPQGYVAISDNGSANVAFRIEDGALESEFCDPDSIEDCDVEVFTFAEEGCLRVFNQPGAAGEILGSQACIPPSVANLGGLPVEGEFVVIMTLEKAGVFQGGAQSSGWQVPFFPDIKTVPEGISFDLDAGGVTVTICQDPGVIEEGLHQYLRPFLILSDGTTTLPEEYYFEIGGECEAFGDHHAVAVASDQGWKGAVLGRLAGGISKATRFFLPQPLNARRRLHGGLNTVIGDAKTSRVAGAEGVSGLSLTDTETTVLELGALLDVDPFHSQATVPPSTILGSEVTVIIEALNYGGDPFPFEVPVTLQALSGTDVIQGSVIYDPVGNVYIATYTPTTVGDDAITITVDGGNLEGNPFSLEVQPVGPSAANSSFEVSASETGSPTTVTVTVLDENGQPYVDGADYQIDVSIDVTDPNTGGSVPGTPIQAEDDDGQGSYDGSYEGSWTPQGFGSYSVTVTINGDTVGVSQTITTAPRPADAAQSRIVVQDGLVDSSTPVAVVVKNTAGEIYDLAHGAGARPITVNVSVSGANTTTFAATDPELDGTYEGAYTPANPGLDYIDAVITDGTLGNASVPQATSDVAPLTGPLTVQVQISGPASAYVYSLPVQLYDGTGNALGAAALTNGSGTVTFADVPYGFQYTVHLVKRDFDVQFPSYVQTVNFDRTSATTVFAGTSQALPSSVLVWRIGAGGNGNAYEYTVGGRSWTSANNQIRDYSLLGVGGHLATLTSAGENAFVASFFTTFANLCPGATDSKQCKFKGWIGLSDEVTEGAYKWVTGEAYLYGPGKFTGWPGGTEPIDRKGNQDYVEINLLGEWSITNGASTTNEGYFTEWEAQQPNAPTF